MIRIRERSDLALDLVRIEPVEGSMQAIDHRREELRLEFWRSASEPLFLWPVLAAMTQVIL